MANIFDQFDQNMPENATALPNQIPTQPGSSGSGYADVVESAGAKWGIPAGLMTQLVGKESSGNPSAVSNKGALGLTQVMPDTAREMGYDPAQLAQDPAMQADAGAQYLSRMYQRYGDWGTALQAYHDGPGNVDKQLAGQATPGPEGRQYVDDRFNQWTGRGAGSDGSGEPTQYATSARSPSAGGNVFDQFGDYQPPAAAADGAGAPGADQQVAAVAAGNAPNQAGSDGAQGAAAPNSNGVQSGANQPGQTDPNEEAARNWEQLGQTVLHSLDQGARGVAQTGIDLLNTPISLANMISQAVTDAGKGVGLVDQNTQAPTITPGGIPGLAPTDKYAQIGTLIGDMLAPLPGPRKAQAATELLGLVREAPDATSFATRLADMTQNWIAAPAARAVPGAIAAGRGDPEETLTNIALAPAGEAIGRAVIGGAGKLWNALRAPEGAAGGAADAAADATRSTQATEAGISDAVARDASKFRLTPDRNVQGANGETLRASDDAIDLANMADVDRKVLKSAQDLGIEDYLTPAAYSRDQNFRNTVQQLASRKGSALEGQQAEGISRLAGKADELIDNMSSMNASTLDQAFSQRTRAVIDELATKADGIYTRIGEKLPKNAQIDANNTLNHLWAKADVDGLGTLDPVERKALDWLQPVNDSMGPPTYSRLDKLRQQVGAAISKREGPFKDSDRAALKQLYARLTEDQEAVAARYGAADDWNAGKQLVKRRKDLETIAIDTLGKNLDGSISGKVQNAILNLGKKGGSARDWDKLMAATPESIKQDVVANAIQRTLAARSQREGSLSIPGFVDWYRTAQANGTLGSVMKHLSRPDRVRLMQIYRVGNAIDKAKRLTTTTGSIGDFVKRFDDPSAGGVLSRLYGTAGWLGKHAAAYFAAGPAGNAALSAAQAARGARVPRSVLADNLLSSPDFSKLMQAAAAQSSGKLTPAGRTFVREAEQAAANSPEWRALYEAFSPEEKAAVNRAGIVGFFSGAGGRAAATDQQQQQ